MFASALAAITLSVATLGVPAQFSSSTDPGEVDLTFNATAVFGASGTARDCTTQYCNAVAVYGLSDGDTIIAMSETSGSVASVTRLSPAGAVDWRQVFTSSDLNSLKSVAIREFDDGSVDIVLAGSGSSTLTAGNYLIRLDGAGTIDTSFNTNAKNSFLNSASNTDDYFDSSVTPIITPDRKVWLANNFGSIHLLRADGTMAVDQWQKFALAGQPQGFARVNGLALREYEVNGAYAGSSLLVAGDFTSYTSPTNVVTNASGRGASGELAFVALLESGEADAVQPTAMPRMVNGSFDGTRTVLHVDDSNRLYTKATINGTLKVSRHLTDGSLDPNFTQITPFFNALDDDAFTVNDDHLYIWNRRWNLDDGTADSDYQNNMPSGLMTNQVLHLANSGDRLVMAVNPQLCSSQSPCGSMVGRFHIGSPSQSPSPTPTPTPTVTSVDLPALSPNGGETITVTGTGFTAGMTVFIENSGLCTNVTVISATTFTCTTPTGANGPWDMEITINGVQTVLTDVVTFAAVTFTSPSSPPAPATPSPTSTTAPTTTTTAPADTTPAGTVSGVVYLDTDRDGSRGSTEVGVADATVELVGSGAPATATDDDGAFTFSGVTAGEYSISVGTPAGIDPASVAVSVTGDACGTCSVTVSTATGTATLPSTGTEQRNAILALVISAGALLAIASRRRRPA